ncbi:MAG: hypothetical protein AAFY81_00605 [Pseudomonadota bacterium]
MIRARSVLVLSTLALAQLVVGLAPLPAQAADKVKDLAKLEEKYEKELKRCREGERRQCDRAKLTQADIEELKRVIAQQDAN